MSSVLDGETLALRNGREVRLLGIKAPVPPPGWEGPEPWPFAVQAMQALAALLEGATVELRFDARKEDRHGHVLAQVSVDRHGEPAWRGLWRSLTYQVRKAHAPKRLGYPRHTYQHVEGQAHGIGEGRKLVYINFAEDSRHDFTVTIKRKCLRDLEAGGLDLTSLPGAHLRARLGRMVERADDRDLAPARDRGCGCSAPNEKAGREARSF